MDKKSANSSQRYRSISNLSNYRDMENLQQAYGVDFVKNLDSR